ncbi:MAG: hypothetical protein C0502_08370 [Opitutus sp.]|nr:hypothetical protein [Opitutus sp.]
MNALLRRLTAAACAFACTLAFAADPAPAGSAEESAKLATGWLALVDSGDYATSWKESASRFRAMVSQPKWVAAMEQVRQPLGSVSNRELVEAVFTHEVPRAPKGDYWQVKFKTTFEAIAANEVITLVADTDGTWRVFQFFIRPAS